jgi:CIC family chloride channel protein
LLSHENIYTIKLLARWHFIPKAMHANMFLVRRAGEVMDRDILILLQDMSFDAFLRLPDHGGRMRHVVIARGDEILGGLRVNTGLRHGLEGANAGVTLGEVGMRNFTIAGEKNIVFNVIGRITRENAAMVIVSRTAGPSHATDVSGRITKEHIADSVAESIGPYAADELSS